MQLELKVTDTSDNILPGTGKGVLKALSNPINGFGAVKLTDLKWKIDERSDTIIIQGTASDSTKQAFRVEISGSGSPPSSQKEEVLNVFLEATLTDSSGRTITMYSVGEITGEK